MRTVKLKRRMVAALAVVAGLALGACGGGGNAAQEAGDRPKQMYTWYASEADKDQWDAYVAAAQEADAGFELGLSGVAINDFYTKAVTRMQQDDAPCLITTQAERAQGLAQVLAPIDDAAAEAGIDLARYNAGMIEGLTIDGSLRGVPLDAAPSVIYYNKKLFAEAGLEEPTLTWSRDDFLAAAKKLAELDGVTPVGLDSTLTSTLFYAFGNGSVPVKDGQLNLTDPKFVSDVQWVFDLAAVNQVADAPDSSVQPATSQQNYQAGTLAMYADGPWKYQAHIDALGDDMGIAVPPSDSGTPTGIVRGTAVGIANNCPDKVAAAETLKVLASAPVLGKIAADRGQIPGIPDELGRWSDTKTDEADAVVGQLLQNSQPLLTTSSWDQVVSLFQQYSPAGFNGSQTAEQILTQMQDQAG